VRKAAQAGALLGLAGLVVGVDLDDEALGVHLVAVVVAAVGGGAGLAVVPAQVLVVGAARLPAMARCGPLRAAVTLERGDALVVAARGIVGSAAEEVAVPVLLARQQRAPGRLAGAAVVERAARARAVGGILGDHQRIAACGARQVDVRQCGDAEVEGRVLHIGPFACGLAHFHHRHAVDGQLLVHLRRGARQRAGAAVGVQEEGRELLVGRRLVVHAQQATVHGAVVALAVGAQAEPLHAVVVVSGALVVVGVGTVVLVPGHTSLQRITQRIHHAGGVARRNHQLVGQALAHGREAQQLLCGDHGVVAASAGAQAEGAQHGRARRGHATTQQATSRQACAQHRVKRGVGRGVGVLFVKVVGLRGFAAVGHGSSSEGLVDKPAERR